MSRSKGKNAEDEKTNLTMNMMKKNTKKKREKKGEKGKGEEEMIGKKEDERKGRYSLFSYNQGVSQRFNPQEIYLGNMHKVYTHSC